MKDDHTLMQLASSSAVHLNQITSWAAQLEGGAALCPARQRKSGCRAHHCCESLHTKLGELTLENDRLDGALTKAGLLSAK
ncbi:transposase [Bradyrhizobium sp. LB7.2]